MDCENSVVVHSSRHGLAARLRWFAVVGLYTAGWLMSGCSGSSVPAGSMGTDASVDPADPWSAEFDKLATGSSSEFVVGIVADHEITFGEYTESQDRYVTCLEEAGLHPQVSREPDGLVVVGVPTDEADSESADACYLEWDGGVGSLYTQIWNNPNHVEITDLVAACLVRAGLVESGFTGADLVEVMAPTVSHIEVDEDGNEIVNEPAQDPNGNPTMPGGVGIYDEEAMPCWTPPYDPSGQG